MVPPDNSLRIDQEDSRLRDLPSGIHYAVCIDHLMIDVGKDRERKLETFGDLAALFRRIYADCEYLSPGKLELIDIRGQTGQLLAAERSPIASVEDKNELGFIGVIAEPDGPA
jgi:hypothetical protein